MQSPGFFITFEGIDGSGKSTQLRLVASELNRLGYKVETTREPGGTPLGNRLRTLLLDTREHVDPLAELLMYAADRAQHVRTFIKPALAAGHIVLSDRYMDATFAYQGAGRGFSHALIEQVVSIATEGLKPHLTLLFDLSIKEGRSRIKHRAQWQKNDRLDREELDFHSRVRDGYLQLASAEPERIKLINATGTIQETHLDVMTVINSFLRSRLDLTN
jgi:dTMP kinase